jgi:hypothetical protein
MAGDQPGPSIPLSNEEKMRNKALYQKYIDITDPVMFNNTISSYIDGLTNTSSAYKGIANKSIELQAKLRQSKLSKDATPLGIWTENDLNALRGVMRSAYTNGQTIDGFLDATYLNPQYSIAPSGGPSFSKSVSTAMHLVDQNEAKALVSKAYYTEFGFLPDTSTIQDFMNKYNATAKKQVSKTVTTTTSSGAGTGSTSSTSTTVTTGKGMDQEAFISDYLAKNFNLDKVTGGLAKDVINQLQQTATNNLLPQMSDSDLIKKVTRVISASDPSVQKQILQEEMQKIRDVAGKLNPGVADITASGRDISDIANSFVSLGTSKGMNVSLNSPIISKLINYKDAKGNIRVATSQEANGEFIRDPNWVNSAEGINSLSNFASGLSRGMGLA